MAITAMDTKNNFSFLTCLLCLTPFFCNSGEWRFEPGLNINEQYSDNIELTPSDKVTSLISQTSLLLDTSYNGKNSVINLNSASTYAWYSHDHSLDKDYHTLSADSKIMLWPNGIALLSNINIRNQSRNEARNNNNDITYGDTTQTRNYQLGFEYQINNRNHRTSSSFIYSAYSSEDNIGEQDGTAFQLSSNNGVAVNHLFWDTSAIYRTRENNNSESKQHRFDAKVGLITDYKFTPFIRYYEEDNSGNISNNGFETKSYGLGFRWQVKPRLFIDLSYNEPIETDSTSSNSQNEAYLDLLVNWQPTSRTKLLLSHSERFYGNSYGLNISHRNRRLTNTINYNEQIQSFTRDNYQVVSSTFICQNPDAIDLSDCFIQNGDVFNPEDISLITINSLELVEDNDYWLNKRFQWSSMLTLPRTSFSFNLNHADRKNLNSGSSNTTKSASINASRKLSPGSTFGLQASYDERSYDQSLINRDGQTDKYRRYGINFKRSLNQALDFTLDLDRINRTSNQERYNYSENRLSLRLTKDF